MTKSADTSGSLAHRFRFSRRTAVVGGVAAAASLAGGAGLAAQTATPQATPAASPSASPIASPVASPVGTPIATPVPVYPLKVIHDQRPEWAGTPEPGGDLRLFINGNAIDNFTPTVFQQDFQITTGYLDPLVWVDEVSLEPKPWIAKSWTWSSDGSALTFTLRDDVKWHDGSPLTAEDVQFSFLCYRDDYDSVVSFMFAVVSDVETSDDHTVVVRFDEPDGTFPFNAANLPIFSKAQYDAHWTSKPLGERTLSGFDFGNSTPLGTGPWKIDERNDDEVTFTRNDDHFVAVPLADTLTLAVEADPGKQLDAWKQGDVDLIWPLDGTKVEGLLNDEGSLVGADSTTSFFAAYNFGNPTRNDPGWMASIGLREALSRVVNREGYAESVFGGFIDVARGGIMTQPWSLDDSIRNPQRDLDAARKLLSDNGWSDWDGDGILDSPSGDRGSFVMIVREDANPQLLAILDTLNEDFGEVGLSLEVQRLDAATFEARWTTGFDYDLIAISLNQYPAFTEFDLFGSAWSVRRNPAGWNPGGYWNPDVDKAIADYLAAWEIDDMRAALKTIQQVTNVDPFALWLGFPQQPVLIRPDIAGFQPNKMWQSWNTWSLWRTDEQAMVATPIPATPEATPLQATPDAATPVASPAASSEATPDAS